MGWIGRRCGSPQGLSDGVDGGDDVGHLTDCQMGWKGRRCGSYHGLSDVVDVEGMWVILGTVRWGGWGGDVGHLRDRQMG